ncbi:DUF1287 domain-containing protein [Persicirhabdus sediminis]|nr:DUF1287 domain-containing protein [Persicirhabdus sediminis]
MLLLVGASLYFTLKPSDLLAYWIKQHDLPTDSKVEDRVSELQQTNNAGDMLAAAALLRTTHQQAKYDPDYCEISYPMGDIPADRGSNADLIVRAFRSQDIDLQQLIHEDMLADFRAYPQLWGSRAADSNIDHRRLPNIQRFFERQNADLKEISRDAEDYEFGDLVSWRLPYGDTHMGIVVPGPGERGDEKWIVHNMGDGAEWQDVLFEYQITGHYRFFTK